LKDLTKWWFIHVIHWAVMYGAFAANLDGAMYVLKFWVWIMAPISLTLLADKAIKDTAQKPARPIRSFLSMTQAWVMLFALVWFGHIATGLAWAFVILVTYVHKDQARKLKDAPPAVVV